MSGNLTPTTNASFIVPEVIANEALGLLGAYLNLGKTCLMDGEMESTRLGKTISIPKRGVIVAQQKVADTDAVLQTPTGTDTLVQIDQHWYVRLAEEDATRAIQKDSTLPGYVEDGVIVLAEKIETVLASHIASFDNIDAGGSDGDAYKGVVNVRKQLIKNKVPKLMQIWGYISPDFNARLLKEAAFVDPKTPQAAAAREMGAVGRVANVNLFEGQLVPTNGSPAWDQNFFYTKYALVLASRPMELPEPGMGVIGTNVQSEAGLALRYIRGWDSAAMAKYIQLDTLFGAGVNDLRQGYVLESQG